MQRDARNHEESAPIDGVATEPPINDPTTSGMSWARLIAPTWNDECVWAYTWKGIGDDRELRAAWSRRAGRRNSSRKSAALAQRRGVDQDPAGHRAAYGGTRRVP